MLIRVLSATDPIPVKLTIFSAEHDRRSLAMVLAGVNDVYFQASAAGRLVFHTVVE